MKHESGLHCQSSPALFNVVQLEKGQKASTFRSILLSPRDLSDTVKRSSDFSPSALRWPFAGRAAARADACASPPRPGLGRAPGREMIFDLWLLAGMIFGLWPQHVRGDRWFLISDLSCSAQWLVTLMIFDLWVLNNARLFAIFDFWPQTTMAK